MNKPAAKSNLILLADDDPDALNLVNIGVSQLGFQTVEAHDGDEAVRLFDMHSPDMAILDLMMPGKTGSEVCEYIKGTEKGRFVPVVMLTALKSVENKVEALEGGADDYLTKPFHVDELQARVKAQLRVRDLNLNIHQKNLELVAAQEKLLEQERRLVAGQIAGTAAHQLGQPLSAIMLNCHLLERLSQTDERFKKALSAIKSDAARMAELIEKLRKADPSKKESYYGSTDILTLQTSGAARAPDGQPGKK